MIFKDELELVNVLVLRDEEENVLMFEVRLLVDGQFPVVRKFIFPLEYL